MGKSFGTTTILNLDSFINDKVGKLGIDCSSTLF